LKQTLKTYNRLVQKFSWDVIIDEKILHGYNVNAKKKKKEKKQQTNINKKLEIIFGKFTCNKIKYNKGE